AEARKAGRFAALPTFNSSTSRLFDFSTPRLFLRNGRDVDCRPTLGHVGSDEGFSLLRVTSQRKNRLSRRRLDNGQELIGRGQARDFTGAKAIEPHISG